MDCRIGIFNILSLQTGLMKENNCILPAVMKQIIMLSNYKLFAVLFACFIHLRWLPTVSSLLSPILAQFINNSYMSKDIESPMRKIITIQSRFFSKKRNGNMTTMTLQYGRYILGFKLFNLKIRSVTPIFYFIKRSRL